MRPLKMLVVRTLIDLLTLMLVELSMYLELSILIWALMLVERSMLVVTLTGL